MLRKSVKKLTPVEETVRVATPVMVNGRKHYPHRNSRRPQNGLQPMPEYPP